MKHRFQIFAYAAMMLIFSTVSAVSYAGISEATPGPSSYQVRKAGYVNSPNQTVEVACRAGDRLVRSTCDGRLEDISVPRAERMPFPFSRQSSTVSPDHKLDIENAGEQARCQPKTLRMDQQMMLIVTAFCQPSQT